MQIIKIGYEGLSDLVDQCIKIDYLIASEYVRDFCRKSAIKSDITLKTIDALEREYCNGVDDDILLNGLWPNLYCDILSCVPALQSQFDNVVSLFKDCYTEINRSGNMLELYIHKQKDDSLLKYMHQIIGKQKDEFNRFIIDI